MTTETGRSISLNHFVFVINCFFFFLQVNENVLLRNIVESDAGVYTCIASDIRGNQVASISARVTILQHGLNGEGKYVK